MTRISFAILAAIPFIVLTPQAAKARCRPGLAVWPSSETLPANGRIAIEGYGFDREFVRSLPDRRPRLVSRGDVLPLTVTTIQEGAFQVTQAILVPERPLEPGRRYRLAVEGRRSISTNWTAVTADHDAPAWDGIPVVQPSTYQEFGCGPSVFAHVAVAVRDSSSFRIRIRLRPTEGRFDGFYDVSPIDGVLSIGHGMCSGPYELEPGAQYQVTLEAIDAAGNVRPAPGGPIILLGPELPAVEMPVGIEP